VLFAKAHSEKTCGSGLYLQLSSHHFLKHPVRSCHRVTELSLGENVMCLRFCISTSLVPSACHKEWPHIFEQVEAYTCVLMSQGLTAFSCICLQCAAELEPEMLLLIYNVITKKRICPIGNRTALFL